MSLHELASMTTPQVAAHAAADGVLAVPVGSTEQHGPHLPLGTDTDVALALCRALAARCPWVAVAPPVAYGASGEHAGFAGTLSIGLEVMELVLLELGRSAGETYRRLVFVSCHGGNGGPAVRAVRRLRAESRDVLLWTPRFDGDAHAGRTETSLQLALGARVDPALAGPGNPTPIRELLPALREHGVRALAPNGILGDPTGASAAEGQALLTALTEDLTTTVETWLSLRH
jgi:mycofactocin precursor peptide peptidase